MFDHLLLRTFVFIFFEPQNLQELLMSGLLMKHLCQVLLIHVKSLSLWVQPLQDYSQNRIIVPKTKRQLIHIELVAKIHGHAELHIEDEQLFQYLYLTDDGLDEDVAADDLHIHQKPYLIQNYLFCFLFKFVVYVLLMCHAVDAGAIAHILKDVLAVVFLNEFADALLLLLILLHVDLLAHGHAEHFDLYLLPSRSLPLQRLDVFLRFRLQLIFIDVLHQNLLKDAHFT